MKTTSIHSAGFTIIEMLLSVALLGVLAGLSAPIYQSLQARNDLDIAATIATQTLRRAQVLSQAVDGDAPWGLRAENGAITLFQGDSYAGRNSSFDETFSPGAAIEVSGVQEFTYERVTGAPRTTGTLMLTSNDGEVRAITVNAEGTILY